VDNEGKACLDDLALAMQRDPNATLDLYGNGTTAEKTPKKHMKTAPGEKFAAERAVNTKDYLVKEKGVDASRIKVFTGSDDSKTVTSTIVPQGATDSAATTPVDESAVKVQPRTPVAAKHHKKKS
jgi:hypothetical protein